MVALHLFSAPGETSLEYILEAAAPILQRADSPLVAHLPAASMQRHWTRETKAAFRGLAEVRSIKPEIHTPSHISSILQQAALLYIPGGNTYLLAKRLHETPLGEQQTLFQALRSAVYNGLPLVGFSAGTVICGKDILTTNDINCCDCTQFAGFSLLPYNLNVHYPESDGIERQMRLERLGEYLAFHSHPILALEDRAYLQVDRQSISVIREGVWLLEASRAPVRLAGGTQLQNTVTLQSEVEAV